jgi:hypothetical protein
MRSNVLPLLIAALVVAQSCLCFTLAGGPQPPYDIVPAEESAKSLRERWNEAANASPDGTFSITVSEEEMTALVAQALAEQEDVSSTISDPQVYFRDNRVEVYASVKINDTLSVPGMVAFSLAVAEGNVTAAVEEVAFGSLPIPESALETATSVLNELIAQSISGEIEQAAITGVQIGDGEMILSGVINSE